MKCRWWQAAQIGFLVSTLSRLTDGDSAVQLRILNRRIHVQLWGSGKTAKARMLERTQSNCNQSGRALMYHWWNIKKSNMFWWAAQNLSAGFCPSLWWENNKKRVNYSAKRIHHKAKAACFAVNIWWQESIIREWLSVINSDNKLNPFLLPECLKAVQEVVGFFLFYFFYFLFFALWLSYSDLVTAISPGFIVDVL